MNDNGSRFFLGMMTALFLFTASVFIKNNEVSIFVAGAGVFVGIFYAISSVNIGSSSFEPEPMPVFVERKEITVNHIHEHRHHTFKECTEGKELSRRMPDGTIVSLRHVKRWK